jgi:hypothetical protein
MSEDDEMERALAADREKLTSMGGDPGPTEAALFGSMLAVWRLDDRLVLEDRNYGQRIELMPDEFVLFLRTVSRWFDPVWDEAIREGLVFP